MPKQGLYDRLRLDLERIASSSDGDSSAQGETAAVTQGHGGTGMAISTTIAHLKALIVGTWTNEPSRE